MSPVIKTIQRTAISNISTCRLSSCLHIEGIFLSVAYTTEGITSLKGDYSQPFIPPKTKGVGCCLSTLFSRNGALQSLIMQLCQIWHMWINRVAAAPTVGCYCQQQHQISHKITELQYTAKMTRDAPSLTCADRS